MAVKLQGTQSELFAIYSICESKENIRTRLLSRLRDDHFNHSPAKKTWRRLKALLKSGRGTTPKWEDLLEDTSLDSETRDVLSEFETKKRLKTPEDVTALFEALDSFRIIRAQVDLIDEITTKLESDDEGYDPRQYTLELQKAVNDMLEGGSNVEDDIVKFGMDSNSRELIDNVLDQTIKPNLIPTGFKTFDDVNGGLPYGLTVIAGSTGAGKSTLASVQLLINMSLHAPTCLVPLEMSKGEMVCRIVANKAQIDVGKVVQKKLTDNEVKKAGRELHKWEQQLEALDSYYSIYEPSVDQSIEEILYGLQPYGYKVILIDYIGLLKNVDGDDSWQKLGEAARFAKIWANRNGVCVILLAQLSEEGVVRYSRAIMEHANNAWTFNATQESRDSGTLPINQPKARNQNPMSFELGIEYATMRVYDLEGGSSRNVDNDDEDDIPAPTGKEKNSGKKKAKPVLDDDDDEDDTPIITKRKDPRARTYEED